MTTGEVRIETAPGDPVAVLRIVNPGRKNAISGAMWAQFGEHARALSDNSAIRAVLIRSGDDIFSAGADISGFAEARSGAGNAASYDDLVEMTCRDVEAITQPTLCLIQGPCLGAGASLAASCDIRICSERASFAVPAARLGLGYDIRGIARFRRVFGHAAATAMLFTAGRMGARAAHACGAVYHVTESATAESETLALAQQIAANAPLSLRAAKLALRALAHDDDALREQALLAASQADASDDYREGRAAFAEKRPPRFTGA